MINADGTFTYSPEFGYSGSDTVVVTICDDGAPLPATCSTDTIFITITPALPPIAVNDTLNTLEDTPVSINLTLNDSDPDGFILVQTVDLESQATIGIQNTFTGLEGTISVDANGLLSYSPALNYCGTWSAFYTIQDNDGEESNIAEIVFNVTCVNDAPILDNENLIINEDVPGGGDLTDLGDSDVDGNLVVNTTPLTGHLNGTILINPDGTFTYTPTLNFNGFDTVVVEICDDGFPLPIICGVDTIFIEVLPINDAATLDNEMHLIPMNTTASGDLTDAGDVDIDGNLFATTTPLSGPQFGGIVINADGTYTYTPNNNYFGFDTVVVEICDDGTPLPAICLADTIFIEVFSTFPEANPDNATTLEDTPITFNITSNDTDVDGTIDPSTVDLDPLTVGQQSTQTLPEGNWSIDVSGNITYTPAQDFNGTAQVPYSVQDNLGYLSNWTLVTVTVTPVNDPPVLTNEFVTVPEEGTVSGDMFDALDTDVDGNLTLNTTPIYGANDGVFSVAANGDFTYAPNIGFFGLDTVVLLICDDGTPLPSLCSFDTLFINVTPINHPPTQGNEFVTTLENVAILSLDVLANNIDPTNDPLSVTVGAVSQQGGLVTLNGDNTLDYTPPVDYQGLDTIFYSVCDTAVVPNCVNDTVFITVNGDTDGDGVPDITDLDDDDDGLSDIRECATSNAQCDTDFDGIPDSLNCDSDNDGIPDLHEYGHRALNTEQ